MDTQITCNPAKNWLYTDWYMPSKQGTLREDMKFLQSLAIDNPNIHIYGMVNPLVHTPGNWEIKNNLFKYNYNINYNDKWISTTNI